MTATLRIFVNSVQKELEDERLIVQNLVSTDPFLSAHCVPVLYELEPGESLSNRKADPANRKPRGQGGEG